MISINPGGERPSSVLRLSSSDFEVIFQVTKELHNLPTERLDEIGWSTGQGRELLAVLRSARVEVSDASNVEIVFTDPDEEKAPLTTTPDQVNAVINDGPTTDVRIAIPRAMARKWQALTNAIVLILGERELFLRTGYSLDEVRDSTGSLAILSQ